MYHLFIAVYVLLKSSRLGGLVGRAQSGLWIPGRIKSKTKKIASAASH